VKFDTIIMPLEAMLKFSTTSQNQW